MKYFSSFFNIFMQLLYFKNLTKNSNSLSIYSFFQGSDEFHTQSSRIFKNVNHYLRTHVKVYFCYYNKFISKTLLICHNEYAIVKYTLFFQSGNRSAFIMNFIRNHKRPTMTVPQFFKQVPIHFYRLLRQCTNTESI